MWQFAKEHGFVIVTRDANFEELSLVWGKPPQVIWLKITNLSRAATLQLPLANQPMIDHALNGLKQACVEVSFY